MNLKKPTKTNHIPILPSTLIKIFTVTNYLITQIASMDSNWKTLYVAEVITQGAKTPPLNPFALDFVSEIGPDTLLPNGERQHFILGN